MALAGFTGCEMGGKFPKDVDVLKKALALRGLSVVQRRYLCWQKKILIVGVNLIFI